jgi:hypothetical protein
MKINGVPFQLVWVAFTELSTFVARFSYGVVQEAGVQVTMVIALSIVARMASIPATALAQTPPPGLTGVSLYQWCTSAQSVEKLSCLNLLGVLSRGLHLDNLPTIHCCVFLEMFRGIKIN